MPAGAGRIVQVETGYRSSVAVDEKGGIYVWGWTGVGKVDSSSSICYSKPEKIAMPADAGSVAGVSAGFGHVLAVDNKGQVWSWASNDRGAAR